VKQNEMDSINTTFLQEDNSNESFAFDSEEDKEVLFRYFTFVKELLLILATPQHNIWQPSNIKLISNASTNANISTPSHFN
jgi:hypothetical protein